MKRWKWALLIFELALFAAILILPQVELPEVSFHGGSSPVVLKARSSSVPLRPVVASTVTPVRPPVVRAAEAKSEGASAPHPADYRLSLFCTLIC